LQEIKKERMRKAEKIGKGGRAFFLSVTSYKMEMTEK
jgi:hypothetical protein